MRIIKLLSASIAITFLAFGYIAAFANDDLNVRSMEEGISSPAASIEDIAWLTGRWVGAGLGGLAEEVIAPAVDGQMMGMFRHADSEGALVFYEFYVFAEVGDTLALRIKHFSPALKGWEEKDEYEEFSLVAYDDNAVYFDGLTYALSGENELRAAVNVGDDIIKFQFNRQ
jgi:Domain of unknown function (DUF6265)